MAGEEFPAIKEHPKQPWVKGLRGKDREAYEATRASDIEKDVERITSIFRSFPELEGISEGLIGHLALRFATPMRDCFEEGIQVGAEQAEAKSQAELDRFRQIEINRLGGWG